MPAGGGGLVQVGRVLRAHGLRGECVVDLWSDVPSRLEPGAVLVVGATELRVLACRPFGRRYLVTFEGVDDRPGAEAVRGAVLEAPPTELPEGLWVDQLVGARVRDVQGAAVGTVVAVEANPASDLLVLEGGALIPLCFVVDRGPEGIVVDPPAGLLD